MAKRVEWPFRENRRRRRQHGGRYTVVHILIVAAAAIFACGAAWWHINRLNERIELAEKKPSETVIIREVGGATKKPSSKENRSVPLATDSRSDSSDADDPIESEELSKMLDGSEHFLPPIENSPALEHENQIPDPLAPPPPTRTRTTKQREVKPGQIPDPDWDWCEEEIRPSVVRIVVRSEGDESLGTGFAVGDGTLIVTNSHVINAGKGKGVITIETSDGRAINKVIIKADLPHRDLALLSIFQNVPALTLAREDQFMYLSPIMVLGHGKAISNLRNEGQLTQLNRWDLTKGRNPNSPLANDTWILTFSANIHPGHSGSPVVTPDGLVVGVNSMDMPSDPNANYAIHVKHVAELLDKAVPDLKLTATKLSLYEDIRMKRMRRMMALTVLEERQRQLAEWKRTHPELFRQRSPFEDSFRVFNGILDYNLRRQRGQPGRVPYRVEPKK